MKPARLLKFLALSSLLFVAASAQTSTTSDRQSITEALQWVRISPQRVAQYDYVMTARVRLLLFWVGKDDVGGGYIRRGVSGEDPRKEFIQVLFGSDPQRAPRAINRWGAGTEVSWHKEPIVSQSLQDDVTASAFFGFMKSSRGKSAGEMQQELKKEKDQGLHSFTGILSRVEPTRAVSLVVPLQSDTDYTLHQYDSAQPLMLDHLASSSKEPRLLPASSAHCARAEGFLSSVAGLMDAALAGQHAPLSRCYVYDAQENTLTLERVTPVEHLPVLLHGPNSSTLLDASYDNLQQLDYVSTHKESGKKVYFTMFVGTLGNQRGVPIQIRYQPNWWFQVILNLRPSSPTPPPATQASR